MKQLDFSAWRTKGTRSAGQRILWSAARSQRDDGIRDAVVDAIENAPHRAGVVDDAIGLATLQDGSAVDRPAICYLPPQG